MSLIAFNRLHSDGLLPDNWFFGVVEDVNDPLKIGRCRVRCVGYHPEDKSILPTTSLPWAFVGQPTTSAAMGGQGVSPGLLPGSWVVGWFMDGKKGQMPFIGWSLHGIHKPRPPGYGSAPIGDLAPNFQPPQFHGQPSGAKAVPDAVKTPQTMPGPSGMVLKNPNPNAYNFQNAPVRDTSQIKENSGFLTWKDASNWPSKNYSPKELADRSDNSLKFHRGTLIALDYAIQLFGRKVPLASAYRSKEHQARIKASAGANAAPAGRSQHNFGRAIDFSGIGGMSDAEKIRLTVCLIKAGFVAFGAGPTKNSGYCLHADTRRSGTYWGYSPTGSKVPPPKWLFQAFQQAGLGPNGTMGMPPFHGTKGVDGSLDPLGSQGTPGGGVDYTGDIPQGVSTGGSQGAGTSIGGIGGGTGTGTAIDVPSSGFQGNAPSATQIGNSFQSVTTFYAPGAGGNIEGGFETSRPNLEGSYIPRTLDDVRMGNSSYVTMASNPANYGKFVSMGDVTYRSPIDGQTYTLHNVTGYVHDTGSAFSGPSAYGNRTGLNNFDVAVGDFRGWSAGEASRFVDSQAYGQMGRYQYAFTDGIVPNQQDVAGQQYYSTADIVGFRDPNDTYPDPNYSGTSSVNYNARGSDQQDQAGDWSENVAQRDDSNFNYVPIAEGMAWGEDKSAYKTMYPFNQVIAKGQNTFEMDASPADRINIQHATGTGMEINPDGSKIDKTLGNKFDVNRGNHMTAVQGFMMSSVNGPHYELKASDHVKETQGTVEERKLNDHKVETAGNIFLGAGENIRVNGVNLYFDGATLHIVGEKLMIRAGEIDIKGADALRIESGKGISLKAAEAIKIESAADVNLKAGSDMKLQGGTYHNASGQSNFSTIAWGTAIGPPPAGSGPAPSAPASADAAKDADESNYKTNVTRAKTQTALFKPEAPLPSATDFELDSGTRGGYRDALNQGYTPSGSPVDSDFPMMVGSDDFHEPGCLFTATSMKQVFCNLVDERSLLNVQGVKNFLKYTRRDGIAIPDITVEQLEQIVKVAQKNRYPLDMMIGILSFKNWSGAESVAQNGRQAFQAILSATGGRHPLRGEMYMAYEHGIQAATRLIKKALDPSTMNKYVVQEPLKRKKDASPEDADAARKRELFMLPNAQSFQRWQTFREHYDRMHDRINHGFGRVIIPGLISKLPV